jgi:predicted nicotinamide N-methyase
VLELGAGLGMVSILLDRMDCCKEIVVSDGDDDTMDLLRRNIAWTTSRISPIKLYWGIHDEFLQAYPNRFDTIIGILLRA